VSNTTPEPPDPFDEDGYIEFLEHQSFIRGLLVGAAIMATAYGLAFAVTQYFWS
jgi:hypothetical protein